MENNENINNIPEETNTNSNLTSCKACGALVSKKAPNCPKCGNPIKKSKKGLGCAIGCLTPILIIVLLIVGSSITSGIKNNMREKNRIESYELLVDYIKENGEYINGKYVIGTKVSNYYNKLFAMDSNLMDKSTIYSCVDENDEIYFREVSNITGYSRITTVNCDRNGKYHECIYDFNNKIKSGEVTSLNENKYQFIAQDDASLNSFKTTFEYAAWQVANFDIGITIYDLYGFIK